MSIFGFHTQIGYHASLDASADRPPSAGRGSSLGSAGRRIRVISSDLNSGKVHFTPGEPTGPVEQDIICRVPDAASRSSGPSQCDLNKAAIVSPDPRNAPIFTREISLDTQHCVRADHIIPHSPDDTLISATLPPIQI